MKNLIYYTIILVFCSTTGFAQFDGRVSPIQSGGYTPGILNVRDYQTPAVGNFFILFDDNIFAVSKGFNDRHGKIVDEIDLEDLGTVPIEADINAYLNVLSLNYMSNPIDFLGGATYMFSASPMFVSGNLFVKLGNSLNASLEFSDNSAGFGDLSVIPLMLMYSLNKFDLSVGYSFVAPTGKYATGADDNIGSGYWSHMIQAVGYYYPIPDKSLAVMLSPIYEFHGSISDADVTPGERVNIEYGFSQYVSEDFEITIQGGHSFQVTGDSGDDVYWDTSYFDRLNNFGAGVGYWVVPEVFYLNAKWYETYSNREHFDADFFQLQLMVAF